MSTVPDSLPSGPEWEADDSHRFVDAFLEDLGKVLMRYDGSLSRAEKLGAIEMFKLQVVESWRESLKEEEEDC